LCKFLGLDENKIRKYVKYQEEGDQQEFSLFCSPLKATCLVGGLFTKKKIDLITTRKIITNNKID